MWFVCCLDFQCICLHNKQNFSSGYQGTEIGCLSTSSASCCVFFLCQEALYLDLRVTVDTLAQVVMNRLISFLGGIDTCLSTLIILEYMWNKQDFNFPRGVSALLLKEELLAIQGLCCILHQQDLLFKIYIHSVFEPEMLSCYGD